MRIIFSCINPCFFTSKSVAPPGDITNENSVEIKNCRSIYTECALAFGVFPEEIETPLKLTNQVAL